QVGDVFLGIVPPGCIDVDAFACVFGGTMVDGREGCEQFEEGCFEGVTQAEVGYQARGTRQEEGAYFGFGEAGEVGAVGFEEAAAAARTTLSVDGDARRAEGVHVAVNGAIGYFEALREFVSGHAPVYL